MTFLRMTDPEKNTTKRPNSITYEKQRVQPKIESQQNANPRRETELFCPCCRKRRHQIWFKIKKAANEQRLPSRIQQQHKEYWHTYQDLCHEQHKCTAYELGKGINEEVEEGVVVRKPWTKPPKQLLWNQAKPTKARKIPRQRVKVVGKSSGSVWMNWSQCCKTIFLEKHLFAIVWMSVLSGTYWTTG